MIEKLKEMIHMQMAFYAGAIDYNEYSKYFRRMDNLIIQFVILLTFLIAMSFVYQIPIYVIIVMIIVMIYAFVLQSKAQTLKQQILYGFIWGVTSFITVAIILIVAVEFFGFMQ